MTSDEVASALSVLVSIPSVNPAIAPNEAAGEARIAEFARGWLAGRGVKAWLEDVAPGRPNVVAQVGDQNAPALVLCAHLDTVGTAGMTIPPFEPRIDGDRLYGRGAYDMKGSVAAVMAAMARLALHPPRCRVMAALVADEEHASLGAFDFVRRHRADACIVTEPSDGGLVLAHKGFVWAHIQTQGRAAHGSRWDLGVSAIAGMGRVIDALERFDRIELRRRVHPLVGAASMHCALIQGGTGLSTYASQCHLQVERRTLPGETVEQVHAELADLAARADESARVEIAFAREPSACEPNAAIVGCVRDAVTAVCGTAPAATGVGFWMDAAVFSGAGIPAVNYGPTGAGAHADVEWVDLPSVVRLVDVLVGAAHRFGPVANREDD